MPAITTKPRGILKKSRVQPTYVEPTPTPQAPSLRQVRFLGDPDKDEVKDKAKDEYKCLTPPACAEDFARSHSRGEPAGEPTYPEDPIVHRHNGVRFDPLGGSRGSLKFNRLSKISGSRIAAIEVVHTDDEAPISRPSPFCDPKQLDGPRVAPSSSYRSSGSRSESRASGSTHHRAPVLRRPKLYRSPIEAMLAKSADKVYAKILRAESKEDIEDKMPPRYHGRQTGILKDSKTASNSSSKASTSTRSLAPTRTSTPGPSLTMKFSTSLEEHGLPRISSKNKSREIDTSAASAVSSARSTSEQRRIQDPPPPIAVPALLKQDFEIGKPKPTPLTNLPLPPTPAPKTTAMAVDDLVSAPSVLASMRPNTTRSQVSGSSSSGATPSTTGAAAAAPAPAPRFPPMSVESAPTPNRAAMAPDPSRTLDSMQSAYAVPPQTPSSKADSQGGNLVNAPKVSTNATHALMPHNPGRSYSQPAPFRAATSEKIASVLPSISGRAPSVPRPQVHNATLAPPMDISSRFVPIKAPAQLQPLPQLAPAIPPPLPQVQTLSTGVAWFDDLRFSHQHGGIQPQRLSAPNPHLVAPKRPDPAAERKEIPSGNPSASSAFYQSLVGVAGGSTAAVHSPLPIKVTPSPGSSWSLNRSTGKGPAVDSQPSAIISPLSLSTHRGPKASPRTPRHRVSSRESAQKLMTKSMVDNSRAAVDAHPYIKKIVSDFDVMHPPACPELQPLVPTPLMRSQGHATPHVLPARLGYSTSTAYIDSSSLYHPVPAPDSRPRGQSTPAAQESSAQPSCPHLRPRPVEKAAPAPLLRQIHSTSTLADEASVLKSIIDDQDSSDEEWRPASSGNASDDSSDDTSYDELLDSPSTTVVKDTSSALGFALGRTVAALTRLFL